MRPVTWVKINEIEQNDWAIGGQRLNAAAVHAMQAEAKALAVHPWDRMRLDWCRLKGT